MPAAATSLKRVLEDNRSGSTSKRRRGRGGRPGSRGARHATTGGTPLTPPAVSSALFTTSTKIKQELHDNEEDYLSNDGDNEEDAETHVNNSTTYSKAKMLRMQNSLSLVTQRLEILEKQVTKKNESKISNNSNGVYGPQIVDLLSNILTEMKQLNSRQCCHRQNIAPEGIVSSNYAGIKLQHANSPQREELVAFSNADPTTANQLSDVNSLSTLEVFLPSHSNSIGISSSELSHNNSIASSISCNSGRKVTDNKSGVLRVADDGKVHVTLADGTIAVQAQTYIKKL